MCNVTHSLLVIGKDVIRLPSTIIFNVAHILSVIGKRYIEPLLRNICNVTHILLAVATFLIRSSFELLNQHDMLLTFYVHKKRCDKFHCFSQSLQYHSQSVEQRNVSKSSCSRALLTSFYF